MNNLISIKALTNKELQEYKGGINPLLIPITIGTGSALFAGTVSALCGPSSCLTPSNDKDSWGNQIQINNLSMFREPLF